VTTVKKRRADREECRGGDDNEVDRLIPGGSVIAAAFFEPTGLSEGEKEVITHERCINSTNSRGISIRTIEQTRIDEKDKVTDGFSHLVGNVFRFKASYLSNHQCVWPYGRDVAGFVVNANAKKDIEGNPVHSWKSSKWTTTSTTNQTGLCVRLVTGIVQAQKALVNSYVSHVQTSNISFTIYSEKK